MKLYILILICFGSCLGRSPPTWPKNYTVNGQLQLPYAEINEPFTAYFDGTNDRSKITYYDSMVITLQLSGDGKFGKSFKIAPMTTEKVLNVKTCFRMNGTENDTITAQTVLPDLSSFKLINTDVNNTVWQMTEKIGHKKNTYSMYVTEANGLTIPVRYEMMGYDTLLGSHYDKYYIDYSNFVAQAPEASFNFPDDVPEKSCGGFPGPGNKEHSVTMNPMQEYIHGRGEHIGEMFEQFKQTHNKEYNGINEHQRRLHTFRHNVRFIHSRNRAGLSYTLAVNHLADLNEGELKRMRGYVNSQQTYPGARQSADEQLNQALPDSLDWRLFGAVTPVKDQAVCGSCWSFGTTGTIEGSYFLKTGELLRLSQQELMDCSWGEGNNACDGGEDFRAYQWIMKHGLATEDDYGDYLAADGYCREKNVTGTVQIKGYKNVTSGDLQALKSAIANQGPVSVAIDASHKSLSFYSNGVYYEPECGNTDNDLDHAVLAVGYGVLNGQSYWLVKNSWSTYWGNDGYVLMSQKDNNCGVATDATYVVM